MAEPNLLDSLGEDPFVAGVGGNTPAPALQTPAVPAPPPVPTRAFGDSPALRDAIYNNALQAAQNIKPVQNQRFSLAIENVGYADPGVYTLNQQKRAILESKTLGRRLKGDWVLRTNEGQELERKRASLATVPYLTDRGTFINNGTEYAMSNQLRLRPGVYTRIKKNGLIEAHMNVLRGPSHKIELEPETGVFHFAIAQARIPAVNVLRAMGVTAKQMEEAWGPETAKANMAKLDPVFNRRLIEKLRIKKDPEESEADAITRTYLNMGIDPEVTRRTLGMDKDKLDADVLLRTTSKLMKVSRQEEDPDDRDAIPFQTVHGPEDIIAERLTKSRGTLQKALWKMSREGKLGSYVSNALNDDVRSALLGSRLGMALEEVNPAEILDQQQRVSRMGVGGIENAEAVPAESRAVHPTQVGFIDPLRTAESGQVGVDLRFAASARKGADNKLYAQVRTLDGKTIEKNAGDLYDEFVAFPGELQSDKQAIPVIHKGRVVSVPRDQVTLEFPPAEHLFSAMANLDAGKAGIKGQRMVMATRMLQQALGLQEGEAPLVRGQDADDPTKSYEERYGEQMGAVRTQQSGRVVAVTQDEIVLKQEDGTEKRVELYKDFPFNRKSFVTQTPTVKPGDLVSAGQLIAKSNYTDQQGATALGRNLRIAYVPYKGLNWEDAVVVSESAAKKFTSEHMYMHDHEVSKQDKIGKKAYVGIFPTKFNKDTLAKFDDSGLIKPGTTVQPGDPLFLLAQERERDRKSLLRSGKTPFQDKSLIWDQDYEGVVTDVVNTGKNVSVVVKTHKPSQVGDKVTGRMGDKGLISAVLPDEEMPQDEQGRPFDILVSPLGLNSRINPTQLIEAALGKVAEKTGKPYNLKDFDSEQDYAEYAFNELKNNGLSDYETIVDPKTGRKIPNIATGNRWFMKLHHMAADKLQGRGLGGYSADDSPAGKTDQSDSSKRLGMLEVSALLSAGATEVLREASLIRGQANPEYWSKFMSGYDPTTPEVPFVYDKFVNMLRAAGVNPVRSGPKVQLMALTNKAIDELTGDREITNSETVNWKNMEPVKGGLFDPAATGGHATTGRGANQWAHVKLHTPLPNPVMEEPIRRVLNLTKPKFEQIMLRKEQLNGRTGPEAISQALEQIDLPKLLDETKQNVKSSSKTKRDDAIRKLAILSAANKTGIHPKDWVISKVPVIPPAFRPVSVMGNKKLPLVDDANYLYKELIDTNNSVKKLAEQLDPDDYADELYGVYKSFKAVAGLGEPQHPKNIERKVRGVIKNIIGPSGPKSGYMQRKLLGSTVDFVSRGAIIPNPDLSMDQVGVPESKAWDMYTPMVVRRLVRAGLPRLKAVEMVEQKDPRARRELLAEMEDAVVVWNRAPTLHRYGIMAAKPVLTSNKVIELPPFVFKGAGADVDGDTVNLHALVTPEARKEALSKMLPSRNLFSVSEFKAHQMPEKDLIAGLLAASTEDEDKPEIVFNTVDDAIREFKRNGNIGLGRRVKILQPMT